MALFRKKADASNAAPPAAAPDSASTPFDAFDLSNDAPPPVAPAPTGLPTSSPSSTVPDDFDLNAIFDAPAPTQTASSTTTTPATSNGDFDLDDIFNPSGTTSQIVAPSPPTVTVVNAPATNDATPSNDVFGNDMVANDMVANASSQDVFAPQSASSTAFPPSEVAPPPDFSTDFSAPAPSVSALPDAPRDVPPAFDAPVPVAPGPVLPSGVQQPKAKKKLPVLPLALAGLLLLGAGGAATLLMGGPAEDESAPVVAPSRPNRPAQADTSQANIAPGTDARPAAVRPGATSAARPASVPTARSNRPTSAVAPVGPAPGVGGPPRVAAVPTARAAVPVADLKALWNRGADALHRGDYNGARAAWQGILKQSPNRPGIREALLKLDAAQKARARKLDGTGGTPARTPAP